MAKNNNAKIFLTIAFSVGLVISMFALLSFGSGALEGTAQGRFVIKYTDGSEEIIPQKTATFTPLTITFNNKNVAAISYDINSEFKGIQSSGSWSSSVTQQMELYEKPNTYPLTSSTADGGNSQLSWSNPELLSSILIYGNDLNTIIASKGTGKQYFLQVITTITLTAEFNGQTNIYTTTCIGTLDIGYDSNGLLKASSDNLQNQLQIVNSN